MDGINFEELGTPEQFSSPDTRIKLTKNERVLITPLMVYKYELPNCSNTYWQVGAVILLAGWVLFLAIIAILLF